MPQAGTVWMEIYGTRRRGFPTTKTNPAMPGIIRRELSFGW
jgi:hypothetical protein